MTTEKQLYRKGALILMQRGEYSDKSTVGIFRALVDFYAQDAVKRYKERFPSSDPDVLWRYEEYGNGTPFETMLIQDGYIEELEGYRGEPDGTYELVGPKVQGGKYPIFTEHQLVKHGGEKVADVPRTFERLKEFLSDVNIEGIVWHHPDGRIAKIKRRDFGLRW